MLNRRKNLSPVKFAGLVIAKITGCLLSFAASALILGIPGIGVAQAPPNLIPPGTCMPMPALTGSNVKEALQRLDSKYFRKASHPEPSSLPLGSVLRMPIPRFLEGNYCEVDFPYSDASLTKIPPLKGDIADVAAQKLAEAELRMVVVEVPSEEPTGLVFNQEPAPDVEVPRQSSVTVTVALAIPNDVPPVIDEPADGDDSVDVPNEEEAINEDEVPEREIPRVIGMQEDEARTMLHDAGFDLVAVFEQWDLRPRGMVAQQFPSAGTRARTNETVELRISRGWALPIALVILLGGAVAASVSWWRHRRRIARTKALVQVSTGMEDQVDVPAVELAGFSAPPISINVELEAGKTTFDGEVLIVSREVKDD